MDKHYIPNTEGVIFTNKNKFSFSIDSILLSYFSKVKKDKILIDIGSGTGIVGFRINFLNNLKTVYLIEIPLFGAISSKIRSTRPSPL